METRALSYGLAGLGVLILAFAVAEYLDIRTLRRDGVEISAKLHHVVRHSSLRQNYYSLAYSFDHAGAVIRVDDVRVSVPVGREIAAARVAAPDAPIDILYLPSRPELTLPSRVVATTDFARFKLLLALALILAPLAERVVTRRS